MHRSRIARADEAVTADELNRDQFALIVAGLGGEPLYSRHVAHASLRVVHAHVHVSPKDAEGWLEHFHEALRNAGVEARLRRTVLQSLRPIALALVNEDRDAVKGEYRCHRHKRAEAAEKAAYRGDVDVVGQVIDDVRLLAEAGPKMLFEAARRGRAEVARLLLQAGVNPIAASFTDWEESKARRSA